MGDLEARLAALELMRAESELDATLSAANASAWYLMWNGMLVFFMQCGFGMLETGSVTSRSTENILLKNLLDVTLAALVWWVAGHAIAYDGGNPFIGTAAGSERFLTGGLTANDKAGFSTIGSESGYDWASWFFSFTFASVASTIVSGAVAERTHLLAYLAYTLVVSLLIYPTVVHWVWSADEQRWLPFHLYFCEMY